MDGIRVGSVEVLAKHLLMVSDLLPEGSHSEILILETLLCMITQAPAHYPALVHRVLLELCRLCPAKVPTALVSGLGCLYGLIPAMDVSSWRQLADWLSFHLTNFRLSWPHWQHWAADMASAGADEGFDNTKLFLACLIDKCARSVSSDTMRAALPKDLHCFVPADDSKLSCIAFYDVASPSAAVEFEDFKYSAVSCLTRRGRSLRSLFTPNENALSCPEAASTSIKALAAELLEMVKNREDVDEIETWMEEVRDVDDVPEAEGWRGGLFVQAILLVGGQIPFGGTLTLLDKSSYRTLLRDLVGSVEDQKVMLSAFVEAAGGDQGVFSILLDGLLRRGVFLPEVAASWVFSSAMLGELHRDCWVVSYAEAVVDRSIDMVMAAFLQRRKLLAESDMEVEAGDVGKPADVSGASVTVFASKASSSEDAEDAEARQDQADAKAARAAAAAASLETVEAALVASVESCRSTYIVAVGNLVSACSVRYNSLLLAADEALALPQLDAEFMCLFSLLKRTLRAFHGTESELSKHCSPEESGSLSLTALSSVRARVTAGSIEGFSSENAKNVPEMVGSHLDFY